MTNESLLPGPADIAQYERDGFWVSPIILSSAVLDAAESGMARFYAGDHDRQLPETQSTRGWTAADGDVLRKNDYASLRVKELGELVADQAISATAARLSGAASIRLWHDQLLYKPTDATGKPARVGWHTDRQYWLSCSSDQMLTAWVGFHDVTATNGGVGFLPGSHRWDVKDLDFFTQDTDNLVERIRAQGFPVEPVYPNLQRGQVTFHNCRTVHGSGLNRGTEPRRSLAIHLQPGDNHWVEHRVGDVLTHHPDDDLVRAVNGTPDYTDPQICPQLWPR